MNAIMARCAVALSLLVPAVEATAKQPDPNRVQEIAAMLPAAPRGVGRPIGDREAWARLAKSATARETIQQAESLMAKPMPEASDELYLEFSRNGNRSRYQQVASDRHGRIATLTLAECLENQGRFVPALENVIRAVCGEKSWVLPAHDSSLTNLNGTEVTVDLVSSAIAWEMATADYWLGDKLRPEVRKLIRDQLERRIFKPFEGMASQGKPRLWWFTSTNNWNAVCLANVTGAALTAIDSRERRASIVAITEKQIEYFLSGFTPDGYCSEGLGYWGYGFGHYAMLVETLYQQTGGKIDMMADPRVKQIAQFGLRMEITPGVYPAFADCGLTTRPIPWLMDYLSRRFGFGWDGQEDSLSKRDRANSPCVIGLVGFPNSVSDRPLAQVAPPKPPLRDWFADAGILICRPHSGAEHPFGVALKGGHNAEHHNHNDVGSFVVALGAKTPLVDPGSETYTRRTFSADRYKSNVLNSWGHPVPRVDGKLQTTGRQAAAVVLATHFDDRADTLSLDLRAAYDVASLKQLRRTFVFSREGTGNITVTDEAEFDRPTDFETALITFDKWRRLDPNHLRIGEGADAVDVEIETAGAAFDIRAEEIHEDLHSQSLPTRLGIALTDATGHATITTTIRPASE